MFSRNVIRKGELRPGVTCFLGGRHLDTPWGLTIREEDRPDVLGVAMVSDEIDACKTTGVDLE